MKRPELQIVYRNGQVMAVRPRELEPEPLRPLAHELGFRVNRLSLALEVSERQLHRIFTDSLGMSPKDWMRRERMVEARHLLSEGRAVKEVAMELGFASGKDFSREFQNIYEVTPTEFQRRLDADKERRLG